MRKHDVFGKKINVQKPLFNLIVVFAISILGFFLISYYRSYQLALLEEEQNQIQTSITSQLLINQTSSYQEIESLLPYLPQRFEEPVVYHELLLAMNLAEIDTQENDSVSFSLDAEIPFTDSLSDDLSAVEINMSLSLDGVQNLFDFLDALASLDRIYYVNNAMITLDNDGTINVALNIFTFYMN